MRQSHGWRRIGPIPYRLMSAAGQNIDQILEAVQAQATAISKEGGSEVPHPAAVEGEFAVVDVAGEFDAPVAEVQHSRGVTDLKRLLSIEVPVIVQLGQRRMNVAEVMRLGVGAIIEFSKSADDEMDLLVNNKEIGRGHTVKVGENFGIKITTIGPVKETIKKLGGVV